MKTPKFHTLKIKDIKKITHESVVVTFGIPDHLQEEFKFEAGQNITIRYPLDGEILRRCYSICTAPEEQTCAVAIKKMQNGKFSTIANESLKVGHTLDVMTPSGVFKLDTLNKKYFLFFAAGSGITPILSQIKHLLYAFPDTQITLVYGNKNNASMMFREELFALKNKYIQRLSIHYIFTQERTGIDILEGRINKEKCQQFSKHFFNTNKIDATYICGPTDMIFGVKEALEAQNMHPSKIHFELFNTDGVKKTPNTLILHDSERFKESHVTVLMDGESFECPVSYTGDNILDTVIAHGAELPYSCKGGVCSTCKAKVTQGEVVMDLNYALEPDEIDAGYVLLCQAHPRSPEVFIDFDQK